MNDSLFLINTSYDLIGSSFKSLMYPQNIGKLVNIVVT